jgi:hypothetical protein
MKNVFAEFERGDIVVYEYAPGDEDVYGIYIVKEQNGSSVSFYERENVLTAAFRPMAESRSHAEASDLIKIGVLPEKYLPECKKIEILPTSVLEKIDRGDFGCRKKAVKELMEELYKTLRGI